MSESANRSSHGPAPLDSRSILASNSAFEASSSQQLAACSWSNGPKATVWPSSTESCGGTWVSLPRLKWRCANGNAPTLGIFHKSWKPVRTTFATCGLLALMAASPSVGIATAPPKLHFAPARNEIHLTMERRFGTLPPDFIIEIKGCDRRSRTRIRCNRVRWAIGDSSFEGWATVQMRHRGPWRTTYEITHTNEYCVDTGGSDCVDTVRSKP